MSGISMEEGKELAMELNDKYPAMVYAMTKALVKIPSGSKITSAKVKLVTNQSCEISYVTCTGELCEMKTTSYKLQPPWTSSQDFLKRIPKLKDQFLAPKFHWLVTKPLAFIILVTCGALSYGSLHLGIHGMVAKIALAPRLENGISTIFGSTENFALSVVFSWIFSVFAHGLEAAIAYKHGMHTLKVSDPVNSQWAILIFAVGYPIFKEFQEILEVQQTSKKKK